MTETTREGAPEAKPEVNPRNAAMAQIAKQAHENIAGELAAFNEETGEILPTEKAHPAEPEQKAEAPEKPAEKQTEEAPAGEAQSEEPPAIDYETIVVDGKQVQVERAKLIEAGRRTLQKESAADKRLKEATELLQQAKAWRAGITAPPVEGAQELPQEGAQGNDRATAVDPQALTEYVAQAVDTRLYMSRAQEAAERFKAEFADVVSNPVFATWVAVQEDQRLARVAAGEESAGDPWEAYRKHGEEARKHMKTVPTGITEKADRKRDTVAVTGANVRTPAPQEPKPKSTAELIADMRKARHQRIA